MILSLQRLKFILSLRFKPNVSYCRRLEKLISLENQKIKKSFLRFLILLLDDFTSSIEDYLCSIDTSCVTISSIWYCFFFSCVINSMEFIVKTWVKETKVSEWFSRQTSIKINSFPNRCKGCLFSDFRNPLVGFFKIPKANSFCFSFYIRDLRPSTISFLFLSSSESTTTLIFFLMSYSNNAHFSKLTKFLLWSLKRSSQ